MNFRHIIFLLVYFLATIISISISSSIASEELLSSSSIDTESNKELQIELPPLSTIKNGNNDDSTPVTVTDEIQNENKNNDEASTINSATEQAEILDAKTEGDNKEIKQRQENENTSESDGVEEEVIENEIIKDSSSSSESETENNINSESSIQENLTIPVFSEWTQQQQEAEKKLVELSSNATDSNKEVKNETLAKHQIVKMRQKNYALPDCGAKILASNKEAQSTSSVLSDKDEYMLSPCTDRIWFVVELCDSIQAQRVELANFELFSSPLKSVSISLSNRFPTREWTIAGHFDAKSERDVQSFDLKDVTLFGKFVRVDLEYTNTEHYCPLSIFRIFGTSEIEAFEVENEPEILKNQIVDDEEFLNSHSQNKIENSKDNNILNRAGAAVLSIVQKAAEVLVKSNGSGNKQNALSSKTLIDSCMSLSHNIVCETCSNDERLSLQNLISCKKHALLNLLKSEIKSHLINSIACTSILGFNLQSDSIETNKNFIISILPQKYIAAMCNIVAGDQSKLSLHIEEISDISANLISKKDEVSLKNVSKKKDDDTECKQNNVETSVPVIVTTENGSKSSAETITEIKNTPDDSNKNKTLEEQNIFNRIERKPFLENESEESPSSESNQIKHVEIEPSVVTKPFEEPPLTIKNEENKQEISKIDSQSSKSSSETRQPSNKVTEQDIRVGTSSSEIKNNQSNGDYKVTSTVPSPSSQNAPESVFLRLSNRIKTLEKNMTLSTQYLEELSRRYKKQIEDLQQSYTKLQLQYDNLNQSRRESEKRELEVQKQIQEDIRELDTKSQYMEIIIFVLFACIILQSIFIIVLFKRITILRDFFVSNEETSLVEKTIITEECKNNDGQQITNRTTSRKRSKQRVRKISAPNILSRQNGHNNHAGSRGISPILSRTSSAPHKVNEFIEIKPKIETSSTMLEENDEVLIPNFECLNINDDVHDAEENSPSFKARSKSDEDTASTVSVRTTEDQNSNSSSFNLARRLSSPTQFLKLKKTTSMKVKNGRVNHHHKKAKSESPPKINSNTSCSNFIQKSNSFQADRTLKSFLNRCRCCLNQFAIDEQTTPITDFFEIQFYAFTHVQLKQHERLSSHVCEYCNSELLRFSVFKKELIEKQQHLYSLLSQFERKKPNLHILEMEIEQETEDQEDSDEEFNSSNERKIMEEDEYELMESDREIDKESISDEMSTKLSSIKDENITESTAMSKIEKPFKKTYTCDYCSLIFHGKQGLTMHMTVHKKKEKDAILKCEEHNCDFTTNTNNKLRIHKTRYHNQDRTKPLKKPERLKLSNANTRITCHCGVKCYNPNSLYNHINRLHGINKCNLCEIQYENADNWIQHMKSMHPEYEQICIDIANALKNVVIEEKPKKNDENEHVNVRQSNYECPKCFKKFYHLTSMRVHLSTIHGTAINKYSCSVCGKNMKQLSNLREHLRSIHKMNNNPYICWCNLSFSTKSEIRQHKLDAHDESMGTTEPFKKPLLPTGKFVCFCKKTFFNNELLIEHQTKCEVFKNSKKEDIEDGEFKCPMCEQILTTKSNLIRHQKAKMHFSKKQMSKMKSCETCNTSFISEASLKKHHKVSPNCDPQYKP
ncbi:hypothetical protein PVAND_012273 [Polypedilum vanderplanki]|uniref:Zinc finger protein n=1 Tax=Polypedilum vanderplanki TaxID=319348 RepID=A0A9J6CLY2_POLVA|nr:hypothetical protein PVAND_012273 [Polypedilum vanderplanki]